MVRPAASSDTRGVNKLLCPDCMQPTATLFGVMTSAELLAALIQDAGPDNLGFEPAPNAGDCLVYTLECDLCGVGSLNNTDRLSVSQDPEPTG